MHAPILHPHTTPIDTYWHSKSGGVIYLHASNVIVFRGASDNSYPKMPTQEIFRHILANILIYMHVRISYLWHLFWHVPLHVYLYAFFCPIPIKAVTWLFVLCSCCCPVLVLCSRCCPVSVLCSRCCPVLVLCSCCCPVFVMCSCCCPVFVMCSRCCPVFVLCSCCCPVFVLWSSDVKRRGYYSCLGVGFNNKSQVKVQSMVVSSGKIRDTCMVVSSRKSRHLYGRIIEEE